MGLVLVLGLGLGLGVIFSLIFLFFLYQQLISVFSYILNTPYLVFVFGVFLYFLILK